MSFASTVSCRMRQMIYRLNRRDRKAIRQSSEEGPGSVFAAAQILRSNRLKKPLVVIGSGAEELKDRLVRSLEESDFTYVLWEDLPACPTEEDVDSLRLAWIREVCDCFVVMGDGAAIDCVKAASLRAACRGRTLGQLTAGGEVSRRKLPPVAVIPTVPGSGAEALSWATVPDKFGRLLVPDGPAMVPAFLVMDPELLENIPRPALAGAVMDGICLAVEAYLSGYGDEQARSMAASALKGFFSAAEPCWNSGGTPAQRTELLHASRMAGLAASFAGPGYARALCRSVLALYDSELGDVCAGILPATLEKYGNQALDRLASLASASGASSEESKTARVSELIARIRGLAFRLALPDLAEILPADDIVRIASLAASEANPRYACPVVWSAEDLADVLRIARTARKQ